MYRHGEYSLLPGGLTPREAQNILRAANLADATFTPSPGEDLDDDEEEADDEEGFDSLTSTLVPPSLPGGLAY
jgi:hypothetical protein